MRTTLTALALLLCSSTAHAWCDRASSATASAISAAYTEGARAGATAAHLAYLEGGGCLAGPGILDNLYEQEDAMEGSDVDGAWRDGYLSAVHREADAHGCPRLAYQY